MNMKKVLCKSEIEFVNEVADDCIKNMRKKDKEYLIANPYTLDYHFTYCLYIRNHYIHNRDFSEAPFWAEPDYLSCRIIQMIFSRLLPEYDYYDRFIEGLYDSKQFIELRREYKVIYGEYPVRLIEKYKALTKTGSVHLASEMDFDAETDFDTDAISDAIDSLIHELAELVWQTDSLKQTAEDYGISYDLISENIERIKEIFFTEEEFIPLQVCFLPYRDKIGRERYIEYRRLLTARLNENPWLVEKLDKNYFKDRVLARTALKCGQILKYLPMYQNDEKMVRLSLEHDGEAIQYADQRFQKDREWVKYAIEHSRDRSIMFLECMKPYRKDKELVYLACKVCRWNFVYIDEFFHDDYELAEMCMQPTGDHNTIYDYLSERLKNNKNLAMLDLQEDYPHTESYSAELKDDDEIAARLYELHGLAPWAWHYMSERLKKKYGIEEG